MNLKFLLTLFLTIFLITLTQADLSEYPNNYQIVSQTGFEEIYDITMQDILIDIDESWWLWEWFTDLFGESDSISGTEICIEAEFEDENYPTDIPVFINNESTANYFNFTIDEIEDEDDKYKAKFCYQANPLEEYSLKFGENSIIIEITSAEHLDSSYNFISDIYNEIYQLDDIWSENISDGEFVRVIFKEELNNTRDIKIYPRIMEGTPTIEVYEKDETTLHATFDSIISDE